MQIRARDCNAYAGFASPTMLIVEVLQLQAQAARLGLLCRPVKLESVQNDLHALPNAT